MANQTLCGQEVLDAIRDRMTRGPAEFWVLAPATPTTHLIADFGALSGAFPVDSTVMPTAAEVRDEGLAVAKSNLDANLSRLREIGATVDGPHRTSTAAKQSRRQRWTSDLGDRPHGEPPAGAQA